MNTPLSGAPRNTLMFMSGASDVGIGTVSPQDKLDVNGSARMTSLNVTGGATILGPVRIDGKNVLEFGAGVSGKEGNAGTIGYQTHTADALDIVGAGNANTNRKIKFWAEGGTTFNGSLNVSGNVQLGASPGVSAAGGVESLRMLRRIVNSDGTKFGGGEGFTVKPVVANRGFYDITFTPAFPSVPAASATQIFGFASVGNAPATSEGGKTTDNVVIAHLSADRMRVKTGDGNGNESPRVFSFIVIGPR